MRLLNKETVGLSITYEYSESLLNKFSYNQPESRGRNRGCG